MHLTREPKANTLKDKGVSTLLTTSIAELTLIIEQSTTIDAHKKAQLKSLLIAAKEYAEEGQRTERAEYYQEADYYFILARTRFLEWSEYGH